MIRRIEFPTTVGFRNYAVAETSEHTTVYLFRYIRAGFPVHPADRSEYQQVGDEKQYSRTELHTKRKPDITKCRHDISHGDGLECVGENMETIGIERQQVALYNSPQEE